MRTLTFLLALTASAAAQPVMTSFDPASDGLLFDNQFRNQFTRDIETAGLCGGMVYTALDYRAARDLARPPQWFRPAQGTVLRQYLYDRNVDQIVSNVDRWIELGANPNGLRSGEFFSWGLEGSPSRQFERVRESVDRGEPIPLGLQGCGPDCCGPNGDKCSGNHVVLAIGYEEGPAPEQNRLFIYDPNFPEQTLTLVPRPNDPEGGPFYTYAESEGRTNAKGVALDQRWLTFYADMNYRPRRPPAPPQIQYPADGQVHALVLQFETGSDDFRGGDIGVTITTWDGRSFTFPSVNDGNRWLGGSTEQALLELGEGVRRELFREITITTPMSGGIGGDNWNLRSLIVDVLPDVGPRRLAFHPASEDAERIHRFTGEAPAWSGALLPRPASEQTTLERGVERPGGDYRVFRVPADAYRTRCQAACAFDGTCLAWTYQTRTGMCHLKNALPAKRAESDAVSGIKFSRIQEDLARASEPPTPPASRAFAPTDRTTLEQRTDRPGSDYRSFVVEGASYRVGCQRVCEEDGQCQAWTYSRASNRCWLKNGLPARRTNADTISGIRLSLLRQDLDR